MIKSVKSKATKLAKLGAGIKQSNIKGGVKFTVEETKDYITISKDIYEAIKCSDNVSAEIVIAGKELGTVKLSIKPLEPKVIAKKPAKKVTKKA